MKIALKQFVFVKATASGRLLNPRGAIHDTTSLQNSMALVGQEMPVKAFAGPAFNVPEGSYGVVNGHRRITAARALGWQEIDADLIDAPATEADLLALMIASDVTEPFKPSELGRAMAELAQQHQWGIEKVAAVRGLKAATAQLYIDLAFAPESVQRRVDSGEMSLSAWRILRDKPETVKEAAASLEKPTKRAIRALTQQTPGIGVFDGILAPSDAEHNLLAQIAALRIKVMGQWGSLTPGEQMKARAALDGIMQFVCEGEPA